MPSAFARRFSTLCLLSIAVTAAAQAPRPAAEKTTTTTTIASEPEKKAAALPADSISEGLGTVGGKPIAYKTVAGMLTVGATDPQDAMIGLDGKWLPDSGMDVPPKTEDQPATARMF